MIRILAAVAVVALTACSGSQRRDDDGVRVVEGEAGAVPDRVAVARPAPAVPAAAAAAPIAPPAGPDAPTAVHGDFTDQPLPAELAHLNGLGGTRSRAEERTP